MLNDVVIIDSGGANIASLCHALTRLGAAATVSADPARIAAATHVLLPGVGAAHDAMARLQAAGLSAVIPTLRQPLLGICLGMQLLFTASAEGATNGGTTPCLNVIAGRVAKLDAVPGRPVPHMGWNQLQPVREDPLLHGIGSADYVYFVHSFVAPASAATLATTDYGALFPSVVRSGNFRGVQFHPERSAQVGARLLKNFLALRE